MRKGNLTSHQFVLSSLLGHETDFMSTASIAFLSEYHVLYANFSTMQNSPCDPCVVHCCLHWCALCQEHREMKNRLSDNIAMQMTIVNPPPVQEMNAAGDNRESGPSSANGVEQTNLEMQAL